MVNAGIVLIGELLGIDNEELSRNGDTQHIIIKKTEAQQHNHSLGKNNAK